MVDKISYWTFVEVVGSNGRRVFSKYKCVCGTERLIPAYDVNSLHTTSCGCKKGELLAKYFTTHGKRNHPLFSVWSNMKRRCYSKSNIGYKDYGGRGVVVCDEWLNNFQSFYDWCMDNGWEQGLQIDKDIKGTGLLYSPEDCCITTPKINSNNRKNNSRLEYEGYIYTKTQLAEKFGITFKQLSKRLSLGWNLKESLLTPLKKTKYDSKTY